MKEVRTSLKSEALYTRLTVAFFLQSRLFAYGINVGGQKYFDLCSLLNSAFKMEGS